MSDQPASEDFSTPGPDLSRYVRLLEEVRYRDWTIAVGHENGQPFLRVSFPDTDVTTGHGTVCEGRRWPLNPAMSPGELVQTAFKAVLTAEEHEARERFSYRGRAVFGPHLNVDRLWEIAGRDD